MGLYYVIAVMRGVQMTKGYCKICGREIDEVTYSQFGYCEKCYCEIEAKSLISRVTKIFCLIMGILFILLIIAEGFS